jgi:putative transposase
VSEATPYIWKKQYASLGGREVRELRQLRAENAKLKRLVAADLSLDKHILSEILRKKWALGGIDGNISGRPASSSSCSLIH